MGPTSLCTRINIAPLGSITREGEQILSMAALVSRSLNFLLGIFFIFLGFLKMTPNIIRELHKDLRSEYAKYAKVFPFAKSLGYKVPSKWYRRGVGGVEIFCGEELMVK